MNYFVSKHYKYPFQGHPPTVNTCTVIDVMQFKNFVLKVFTITVHIKQTFNKQHDMIMQGHPRARET